MWLWPLALRLNNVFIVYTLWDKNTVYIHNNKYILHLHWQEATVYPMNNNSLGTKMICHFLEGDFEMREMFG